MLLNKLIEIFNHLMLCLATASHNIKWLKITHICLIWDQTFTDFDVYQIPNNCELLGE